MKRLKAMEKRYAWILAVGIYIFLLSLFKVHCPFRAVTGIPCAGCGMTRAYIALLHLDFQSAFYYHPLFWLVPPAIGLFVVKKGPLSGKKVKAAGLIGIAVIFLLVYILRLFVLKDSLIYMRH